MEPLLIPDVSPQSSATPAPWLLAQSLEHRGGFNIRDTYGAAAAVKGQESGAPEPVCVTSAPQPGLRLQVKASAKHILLASWMRS